jgi:hypothetical protein
MTCHNVDKDYETAMAKEHVNDKPSDTPVSLTPPKQPVTGCTVTYGSDSKCSGYLATPVAEHGGAPTIIVIHEWWGLNDRDQIKSMADQLAGLGYQAFAVELFHQPVTTDVKTARSYFGQALGRKDRRRFYTWVVCEQGTSRKMGDNFSTTSHACLITHHTVCHTIYYVCKSTRSCLQIDQTRVRVTPAHVRAD